MPLGCHVRHVGQQAWQRSASLKHTGRSCQRNLRATVEGRLRRCNQATCWCLQTCNSHVHFPNPLLPHVTRQYVCLVKSEFVLSQTDLQCTAIFNDHSGKGNQSEKDPLDVIRGSSAKGGDLDAAMVLRKHDVDGCFRVDLVHRELAPVAPFCIGWNFPLMELRPDLNADFTY